MLVRKLILKMQVGFVKLKLKLKLKLKCEIEAGEIEAGEWVTKWHFAMRARPDTRP